MQYAFILNYNFISLKIYILYPAFKYLFNLILSFIDFHLNYIIIVVGWIDFKLKILQHFKYYSTVSLNV